MGEPERCPAAKQSSWMDRGGGGVGETRLLTKWGRRRESYWKLKVAEGPDGGKVQMRLALATRPAGARSQVSRWRLAERTDAAVEKCRMGLVQNAGRGSGRGTTPPGALWSGPRPKRSHPGCAQAGNCLSVCCWGRRTCVFSPAQTKRAGRLC